MSGLWNDANPRSGIIPEMNTTKVRRLIGIMILLVSLVLLIWGMWPFGDGVRVVPIFPEDMQLPTPGGYFLEINWLM